MEEENKPCCWISIWILFLLVTAALLHRLLFVRYGARKDNPIFYWSGLELFLFFFPVEKGLELAYES